LSEQFSGLIFVLLADEQNGKDVVVPELHGSELSVWRMVFAVGQRGKMKVENLAQIFFEKPDLMA
jgi:hypothetical protein